MPSADFIYDFSLSRTNVTKWGIHFNIDQSTNYNIQYQIWFNETLIANQSDPYSFEVLSLMRGIDEAICTIC